MMAVTVSAGIGGRTPMRVHRVMLGGRRPD